MPSPVRRVSELMKWVRSGEYDRDHDRRVRPRAATRSSPATEAGDAADHYAERFRAIFKEAGEGVGKAGDKVGDAADKLSDWLRERR